MTRLDKLIELNKLQKLNRRNRLEDKLKQQEYYGEIEELFDPLIKTISETASQINASDEQTLRVIDWQNQQLAKQTKMIEQTRNKTLMIPNEETRDRLGIIVDKDTANIIHLMTNQSNPLLQLSFGDLDIGEFEMNGVRVFYQENKFIVRDNIYEFSDGFIKFLTNPGVTYDDNTEEDENKNKRLLKDIRYDIGKADKKSARYRTIKGILREKDAFGRGLNSNLKERLELLILETKVGHDGLYDEMQDISKQLLSVNIINQEQQDNFVFNYGK